MANKLYTPEGWLNWDYIVSKGLPFNFIIGGRGIGKTYGLLKYTIEQDKTIMFLRRNQTQIDMVTSPSYNPYKDINTDLDRPLYRGFVKEAKNVAAIYDFETDEEGKSTAVSRCLGYATALSTIKNLRGIGVSDVQYILFDEFIPEPHERELKYEGSAFLNAYETINRNRELKGEPPVQAFLLANSNNITSAILMELGLVKMITQILGDADREELVDKERGIGLFFLKTSPISDAKRDTALYRLAPESYKRMALDNQFGIGFDLHVVSRNLKEYRPVAKLGEICIYRHKSKALYYCTTHNSGSPKEYPYTKEGVRQFQRDYYYLTSMFCDDMVEYESELCHILMSKIGVG